ncbi:hypothetical protein R4036_004567 [Salmonella enterica]|nr:hypothetical protein [Salmonella enterica]
MSGSDSSTVDAAVRVICQAIRDGLPFEEVRELPEVWAAAELGQLSLDALRDWWM